MGPATIPAPQPHVALMTDSLNPRLLKFIQDAPTPYHATQQVIKRLDAAGFVALYETDAWALEAGRYYVARNDSSIIAFHWDPNTLTESGLKMVGAHTDSPCLKVKPNPVTVEHDYQQLGVEVYGGVLMNPWFDRDLSLAGRVSFVNSTGDLASRLIDFRRPIAIIPSLAIHLDREANKNRSINPQTDILPLIAGLPTDEGSSLNWGQFLADQLGAQYPEEGAVRILDFELSLYDCQHPGLVGIDEAFLASARLDNLLSCHAGLTALLAADPAQWSLLVCNDHEEVGSASACGAQGPFLSDVLKRLMDKRFHKRSLAALYLDQTFIAGTGNYLRSEILHQSGVHPFDRPCDLTRKQLGLLARTTLSLSRQAYVTSGITNTPARVKRLKAAGIRRSRYRHLAFARSEQPCYRCSDLIERIEISGRRLYLCRRCQPKHLP